MYLFEDKQLDDKRFWEGFDQITERLVLGSRVPALAPEWWKLELAERAERLLMQVRECHQPDRFDEAILESIAFEALLICETLPTDLQKTVAQRVMELRALVKQKGSDYNAGGISILEYWILGSASIFHEIHKRALRLLSLARSKRVPSFEDMPESGLDISAFCLFLLAYQQGGFRPIP